MPNEDGIFVDVIYTDVHEDEEHGFVFNLIMLDLENGDSMTAAFGGDCLSCSADALIDIIIDTAPVQVIFGRSELSCTYQDLVLQRLDELKFMDYDEAGNVFCVCECCGERCDE